MDKLESQVAKIHIGNPKETTSFVDVLTESAGNGADELYVVAELPLLNPSARETCERICLAIGACLRRNYRFVSDASTFENTMADINQELGKLASLGQASWIKNINCIVAVKSGAVFYIATMGKVLAFLYRNHEFSDISCSPEVRNAVKPFENTASGKLRLNDILILSSGQLLNFLSLDRFKEIISSSDFLAASRALLEILKQNGGPEVAFGTILAQQVLPNQLSQDSLDLEDYSATKPLGKINFFAKIFAFFQSALLLGKNRRAPQLALPKTGFAQHVKNFGGGAKNFASKGFNILHLAKKSAVWGRTGLHSLSDFKNFSTQKKFFFLSTAILLLAVIINIFAAIHFKNIRKTNEQNSQVLANIESLLTNSESATIYSDYSQAMGFFKKALSQLPDKNKLSSQQKKDFDKLSSRIDALKEKLEKSQILKASILGSLGDSDRLISLPEYEAVFMRGNIISYNLQTKLVQDGQLKSAQDIIASVYAGKSNAVIFSNGALHVWDYQTGNIGQAFSSFVPAKEDFGDLSFYPTNSRAYVIDKKTGQIINFLISGNTFAKPVIAVNDSTLNQAQSLAIDGNIYVLDNLGLKKYQSGKQVSFSLPELATSYSGRGKIFTQIDFKNIYVMDIGNNRVLVLDKRGNLMATLKSSDFTNLKDFAVDEKNKTIYLLNGPNLLKVNF